MNRLLTFWSIILLMLIGVSCQSDNETGLSGDSGFKISLQEDAGIETRTVPGELPRPVLTNFTLKIVNQSGHAIYDGKYTDQTITASPGQYDLSAAYGDNPVVGLDVPYYAGTAQASVSSGRTTPVTISCGVANALTSVVFKSDPNTGGDFDRDFTSYVVRVLVKEDETHSYSVDITNDGRSAYYRAGSIPTYTFVGTLKDGTSYSLPLTHESLSDPSNFKAKSHCIITLSAGKVGAGLKVKVEQVAVEQVSISETIPVEWLPKPKVEGFANNQLSVVETETVTAEQASIQLKTATPLQELKMKFHFEDERYASLNDKEFYQLSDPEDKQAIETTLGIRLPEVGATGAVIDFAPLANALLTKDGTAVTNTIELDVKANNRWSSEDKSANRIYTLTCTKPEFAISVDPLNCWSWEFLVNEATITSGNAEKIKADLKYQYLDGDQWVDCQTRSGETGRLQQFTIDTNRKHVYLEDNPLERTYKVRALYRGAIASKEETVTLEEPWQLPNSDMEEWHYEYYKDYYYSFNPWSASGSGFWDTSNEFTTRHRHNSGANAANYNGFHSVSYVTTGRTGNAAELRSTANGRGNTRTIFGHTEHDYNKVAGELFAGSANVTMGTSGIFGDADGSKDTYERQKTATFSARPTALKFWYKYLPYNADTWSVYIELLDESKSVIVSKEFTSSEVKQDWSEATLPLDYAEGTSYAKCKYIYVLFRSTVNSGANMPYREIEQTFYVEGQAKTFKPAYVGSVLTIDDISLIYDK